MLETLVNVLLIPHFSDRKYYLNRSIELLNDATFLPVQRYMMWYEGEMTHAVREMKLSHPIAVHMLGFANPDRQFSRWRWYPDKEGLWLNVVTDSNEYLWDIWCNFKNPLKGWRCEPHETWTKDRVHPDYALVTDQHPAYPEGYVLHKGTCWCKSARV